jgi:mitochondrial fission protein ELM1
MTNDQQGRALILSDGKPGHVNQSIAFAKHLGCTYQLVSVEFINRFAKVLSYIFDHLAYYRRSLFRVINPIEQEFDLIVSAGSGTYYANKTLAKRLGLKSVAIMLPKGYRYDFDLIVAQHHDDPPVRRNLLEVPINLAYVEPMGYVDALSSERYVSIIIGGDSAHGVLDAQQLKSQLEQIFMLFPDHKFWMTTSRRTSENIEKVLRNFEFDYAVYYSQQPINPIADFLVHSEYVFITADSTSMISEAASYGQAYIELLPLANGAVPEGKIRKMIDMLISCSCLHIFDGSCGDANCKIKFNDLCLAVSQCRILDLD